MVPLLVHYIVCTGVIDSRQSRLDRGDGKDLSLPECSREQLEKEVEFLFIPVAHEVNERAAGLHTQRIM